VTQIDDLPRLIRRRDELNDLIRYRVEEIETAVSKHLPGASKAASVECAEIGGTLSWAWSHEDRAWKIFVTRNKRAVVLTSIEHEIRVFVINVGAVRRLIDAIRGNQ
jgi:hypothetical protein